MNKDIDLAGRIKVAVRACPHTPEAIAGKMRLSTDELNEICRGRRRISSLQLALLSEITDVPVGYFLDLDQDEEALQFLFQDVDKSLMASHEKTRAKGWLTQAYWLGRNDEHVIRRDDDGH